MKNLSLLFQSHKGPQPTQMAPQFAFIMQHFVLEMNRMRLVAYPADCAGVPS